MAHSNVEVFYLKPLLFLERLLFKVKVIYSLRYLYLTKHCSLGTGLILESAFFNFSSSHVWKLGYIYIKYLYLYPYLLIRKMFLLNTCLTFCSMYLSLIIYEASNFVTQDKHIFFNLSAQVYDTQNTTKIPLVKASFILVRVFVTCNWIWIGHPYCLRTDVFWFKFSSESAERNLKGLGLLT